VSMTRLAARPLSLASPGGAWTSSRIRRRRLLTAGVVVAFVALAYLLPYAVGPYYQQVGYRVLQFGALATAWNLLAGYGGLVCLGSAAFIGLGAYTAAQVGNTVGLPLPLLLLLGALVAAAFAALVSPAMFRLRGLYFTIGTLALSEALRILMVNVQTFGGASGIVLRAATPKPHELYWWALLVAVVATVAVLAVLASPAALSLRAVRDDEDVAGQMGVVTFRTKLWVFALSSALMGLVGALQAVKLGVIEPYGGFGMAWTVDVVAVAIIGGLGTRTGPWIGALFVSILGELLRDYPEVHVAVTGLVLILVIRFAPHGIWGTVIGRWGGRRG
jgi:branched-chain amino acid transport system permease protein